MVRQVISFQGAARAYLGVILAGIPLGLLGNYLSPGIAVLKGQSLAILLPLSCAGIAFALWMLYRPRNPQNLYGRLVPMSLLLVWAAVFALEVRDGQGYNYLTFLVPILCLMLLAKGVDRQGAEVAGLILAWATITICLCWFGREALLDEGELSQYLTIRLPSGTVVAAGQRWEGPFGNPNYAGPALAMTALFALSRSGWSRILLMLFTLTFLVLSGSRSALVGLVVGVLVLWFGKSKPQPPWGWRLLRKAIVPLLLASIVLTVVWIDPTVNGRTMIWTQYWEWWRSSAWVGVGTSQISDEIGSNSIPPWFVHAHNFLLDPAGRFGLAAVIPILLFLGSSVLLAIRCAMRREMLPLALAAAFITIGIVEVHGSWAYLTMPVAWLVIGSAYASSATSARRRDLPRAANSPTPDDNSLAKD